MSTLTEMVKDKKSNSISDAKSSMNMAASKMEWISNLDPAWVEECVEIARTELNIPDDLEPSMWICGQRIDVDFSLKEATFEDVVDIDSASLSYNGNWLEANEEIDFQGVRVTYSRECRLDYEIKDLLRACGKIEDVPSTQQTAMC